MFQCVIQGGDGGCCFWCVSVLNYLYLNLLVGLGRINFIKTVSYIEKDCKSQN